MAKKQKYYVVWNGHEPGIYKSWAECLAQVKNYPGAEYKAFPNEVAAEAAFANQYGDYKKTGGKAAAVDHESITEIVRDSIAVDAACSGNPGDMEYRGVKTFSKEELFIQGPYQMGTNNVGEFLALVHALAMLQKAGNDHTSIYSDSKIAIGWVQKGKARTKLKRTAKNDILFQLLARAESWISKNKWKNPILKWETKVWGEIPADFGRK